ncbi:RAMP superfamily CRISPR-associated protein [Methanobrevibacter smithii]|uniref:RAMP superfamily CRISPR-associated protein n=1 Tax=Methanobrevibacter smithii TaxID=2173 RepID=UPI00307CE854
MFKENFVIKGELVCETGLHIGGANDAINIGGADSIIIRDSVSDLPFIPGSSLKGKLRSLLELNDKKSIQSVLEKRVSHLLTKIQLLLKFLEYHLIKRII